MSKTIVKRSRVRRAFNKLATPWNTCQKCVLLTYIYNCYTSARFFCYQTGEETQKEERLHTQRFPLGLSIFALIFIPYQGFIPFDTHTYLEWMMSNFSICHNAFNFIQLINVRIKRFSIHFIDVFKVVCC